MEETQQVPYQNPVTPVPPIATYPTTQPAPTSKTPRILIAMLVVLLGISGYFGYQNYQLRQQITSQQPTPTPIVGVSNPAPTASPIASTDSKANWKTYTNKQYFYTLKYPTSWLAESFGPGTNGFQPISSNSRGVILSPNNQQTTVPNPMLEIQADGTENLSRPTYDEWVKQTKDGFKEGYKLTNESTVEIAGATSVVLEGEHVYPTSSTYVKQYILQSPENNVFFTITIASDTKQESLVFNDILSTFNFTK